MSVVTISRVETDLECCGGLNNKPTPQRCPYPKPSTLSVTLYCKRGFEDVLKVRILRQGGYPRLSQWTQGKPKRPQKGDVEGEPDRRWCGEKFEDAGFEDKGRRG